MKTRKIQWTNPEEIKANMARGYSYTTARTLSFTETLERMESDSLSSLPNYSVSCSCGEGRHFHVADSIRSFCQTHAFQKAGHDIRVVSMGRTRN